MARHGPFRTLSDPIMADPVRRAHVEEMGRASCLVIALARLLDAQCDTPDGAATTADAAEIGAIRIKDEDSEFLRRVMWVPNRRFDSWPLRRVRPSRDEAGQI